MSIVSFRPAALILLGLATAAAGLSPMPASAAILIKGVFSGKPLRMVVDADRAEADVTLGGSRHLLDLDSEKAELVDADGRRYEAELAIGEAGPKPEIEPWGPGPSIAGHASIYHVVKVDDQICGELLISTWMKPFVDPAVRALAILERVKGEGGIDPAGMKGACEDLRFSSYASAGWPLMAGSIDRPIFKTETISFDYRPGEGELIPID